MKNLPFEAMRITVYEELDWLTVEKTAMYVLYIVIKKIKNKEHLNCTEVMAYM